MSTKNECGGLKGKQQRSSNCDSHPDSGSLLSNLNLNQGYKCLILIPVNSFSKSINRENPGVMNLPDSAVCNNNITEIKNKSPSWNKFSKASIPLSPNGETKEETKSRWMIGCGSSSKNNSTLSLHIAAYENSFEAPASDSKERKTKDLTTKIREKTKQKLFAITSSVIQNPFEFPRQQENEEKRVPEVGQFKSSQTLLNPGTIFDSGINIPTVLRLLVDKFGLPDQKTPPNREEKKIAERLSGILEQLEIEDTLYDLDFEREGFDFVENPEAFSTSDDDPDYEPQPVEKRLRLEDEYSEKQWDNIFDMRAKGYSFHTIQHRYKKLRDLRDISRQEIQLKISLKVSYYRVQELREKGGSLYSKFFHLDEMVVNEFVLWKSLRMVVHDVDIADCAFKFALQLGIQNFKASPSWVLRFKKKHGIVSRKITTYLTKAQIEEQRDMKKTVDDFREKARKLIAKRPLLRVFNTDQTGMKKEMCSGRSMEFQGTKKVEVCIQRSDALTHSYTLQPLIGADGTLHLPVFVCFHERNVPKKFATDLKPFTNIKADHSTSGNMNSELGIKWLKESFIPNAGAMPLLLIDAWPGYKQAVEAKEAKHVEFLFIPTKTTGMLQPLDLFFNRQLKAFIKDLSDKIRRFYGNDIILSDRVGIGKLLHLTFAQFSAPCFKPMIQYTWYCSGYIDERPERFETPVQKCFQKLTLNSICELQHLTEERAFIRCAKCSKDLCFNHFYIDMHDC